MTGDVRAFDIRSVRAALLVATLLALLALWTLPVSLLVVGLGAAALVLLTLRYPIVGLATLAFSVPWGSAVPLPGAAAGITPTEGVVAILGAALIVRTVSTRQNPLPLAAWWPYILLFVVAISLSATQALDMHASAREVIKWAELGVVYLATATFVRGQRQVLALVSAVVAAGVTQAALGFVQLGLNLGPAAFASERAFLRAYGTFDQPNPYAGYLNMIWPLALGLALRGPVPLRRWSWVATFVLAAGVLASESRGALLAGLLAAGVMMALTGSGGARIFGAGAVAIISVALLTVFGVSLGPVTRALTSIGLTGVDFNAVSNADYSSVERAAHWLTGVRIFAANPFLGVGIGNYSVAYPAYHPRGWYASLEHAHNYYINVAAEAGIVGLASYLLLAGSALWYSWAAFRLQRGSVYRAVGLGTTGALVATNFHNLFDVLYVHGMTALLGLLMGLTAVGFAQRVAEATPVTRSAYTGLRE